MASAQELFDAGKLREAIAQVTNEVRSNPGDAGGRTFLFELLCFDGDLDRAEKQLDVIGHQSPQAELGVMIYRALIKGERERRRLFSEGNPPHFLKEPPIYVDMNLEAIKQARSGNTEAAYATLDKAEEERPAFPVKVDGASFDDFRDADDFVAPVLELILKDKYVWMPLEQIKTIEIAAPNKLRDLLWASARVESLDGTIGEVYMPALYESTHMEGDELVKLGRTTDWRGLGSEVYKTVGLRMFRVGETEKTLFEMKSVEFMHSAASDVAAPQ